MKKVLTALLLVTSLSGVLVAAEVRGATGANGTTISAASSTLNPAMLQRRRRRHQRRRMVRFVRRHRNNGRWNNRRGNGRWNNRRWNNRRSRRGGGGGHDVH